MADNYKVMVVDDSSFSRRQVQLFLKGSEFSVVAQAENGVEALSLFQEHTPDLVLLDIIMPEKEGTEVLDEIITVDPDAKVMMLSSMGTEDSVTRCLCLGAKTFVQKPFDKDTLLEHMRKLVNGD